MTLSFNDHSRAGTIAALIQEIVNIYPMVNPPNLTVSRLILHLDFILRKIFEQNLYFQQF